MGAITARNEFLPSQSKLCFASLLFGAAVPLQRIEGGWAVAPPNYPATSGSAGFALFGAWALFGITGLQSSMLKKQADCPVGVSFRMPAHCNCAGAKAEPDQQQPAHKLHGDAHIFL